MVTIRSLRPCCWMLPTLLILLLHGVAGPAWPQDGDAATAYTWDTIGAEFADARAVVTQKGTKDQVIYGRMSFAANRPMLENWYRNYLFPAMATEDLLGEIFDKRDMLSKDLENASDAALHQYLVDLAYEEATRRAAGNYHPYVRYNAMLIVGNLNQTEARMAGGVRYPALRLPRAFDFMVDELKKPDQIDVVRVAAMLGIERHLRLARQRPQEQPIADGRKAEVAAFAQSLLDEKAPPAARNLAAHTWLRRNAADVVAALGAVGDNHSIFDSLVRVVGDAEEPLSLRCTAARALSDLTYTEVTGIDAVATVQQLAALAAYACRTEDTRAKDEEKEVEERTGIAGRHGGAGGMGGMMGPMGGMMGTMGGGGATPGGYPGMPGSGPPGGMGGYPGAGGGGTPAAGGYPGAGGGMGTPGGPGGAGGYPGTGGTYGMPGMFGGVQKNQDIDDLIDRVRRRLKQPLHCVLLGVRGPHSAGDTLAAVSQLATDDQQKAEIAKIVKALDAVVAATDEHEKGLPEMLTQVRSKVRDLESLLPNLAAAAPSAPPDEEALPGSAAPESAVPESGTPDDNG